MPTIYITITNYDSNDQSIKVRYGDTVSKTTHEITNAGACPSTGTLNFHTPGIDLPQALPDLTGSNYDEVRIQAAGSNPNLGDFQYGYFTDNSGTVLGTSFGLCTGSALGYFKDQDGSTGGTSFSVIQLDQVTLPWKIYMNFTEGGAV